MSCNLQTKEAQTALSDFIQDLLQAYINDSAHSGINFESKVLVLYTEDIINHFYIEIFSIDKNHLHMVKEPVLGKTCYSGITIYLTGFLIDNFFQIYDLKTPSKIRSKPPNPYVIIDPSYYKIYLNKRMELDYLKTLRINNYNGIEEIESIVQKHFNTTSSYESADNHVFYSHQVQHPPMFPGGDTALMKYISRNFSLSGETTPQPSAYIRRVLVSVNLFIDREGNACFFNVPQTSGDYHIDQEAIRVAKLISEAQFEPAQHRGQSVKVIDQISFYDWY
jgi:hypothetical protein